MCPVNNRPCPTGRFYSVSQSKINLRRDSVGSPPMFSSTLYRSIPTDGEKKEKRHPIHGCWPIRYKTLEGCGYENFICPLKENLSKIVAAIVDVRPELVIWRCIVIRKSCKIRQLWTTITTAAFY